MIPLHEQYRPATFDDDDLTAPHGAQLEGLNDENSDPRIYSRAQIKNHG